MPQKLHIKNFDSWNIEKQKINKKELSKERFFHEGEIWWGSLGINIGSEQDGKNELFERPLLIIKKFHQGSVWAIPLTSESKNNKFHYLLKDSESYAILSQLRLLSTKRMRRYVRKISDQELFKVIDQVKDFFPKTKAASLRLSRGTNVHCPRLLASWVDNKGCWYINKVG
jgi:UDP-N-acetylbacillosamine transaminase